MWRSVGLAFLLWVLVAYPGCGSKSAATNWDAQDGTSHGDVVDTAVGDDADSDVQVTDSSADSTTEDVGDDSIADLETDGLSDDASDDDVGPDATADGGAPDTADAESLDVEIEIPPLPIKDPIGSAPNDPLDGGGVESCALYQQEICDNGTKKRCEIYDTGTKAFVDAPDALIHRAFLMDRYNDLYHMPDGQRVERVFNEGISPGTPESVWGDISKFKRWADEGDSAIFTGGALTSMIYRYAVTGTEADYHRMETEVRHMLTFFDVTGIPGYLARHHYLYFDKTPQEGAPVSDKHIFYYQGIDTLGIRDFAFDPTNIVDIPQVYIDGVQVDDTLWTGTPYWHGNPSIDQYTGPTIALPHAYNLLRDETLKERIRTQLTCYVKRLRRIDVINLQQNPTVAEAVSTLLGGAGYKVLLDPGDPDLTKLDRITAFYLPSYNSKSAATYDKSCPTDLPWAPSEVIDAAADNWSTHVATFALRLQSSKYALVNSIDHIYVPSVRGGDASHMIRLLTMAYRLTGDEQYRSFLYQVVIGETNADQVAKTMGALQTPDWCSSFFADHITLAPHWSLLTMLAPSPLKDTMLGVMQTEAWEKRLSNLRNGKLGLLYVSEIPLSLSPKRDEILAEVLEDIVNYGGNGGFLDEPRRNYTLERQTTIDNLPNGTTLRCPTEEERTFCEEGVTILGVQFPVSTISYPCNASPSECVMGDGMCVRPLASYGLPIGLRPYEGFVWQRSPFELSRSGIGNEQAPPAEFTEPFWIARYYGLLTNGDKQVLAWKSDGSCP
ncbi:MAG: hypothetical protein KC609_15270 [Myxococcales bacterium]|nr:hypothetical protein [Myxococcales bacterium]